MPARSCSVPFRYARVWSVQVPVYPAPGYPDQMGPVRHLLPPNTWVSIQGEVQVDQRVWYRIGEKQYVLVSDVSLASPSTFHGVAVGQAYHPPFGFVVADYLNVRLRPSVALDNPPLDMLPRYTVVNILGQEITSDGVWYQIGPDRYVHSAYVKVVTATPRPGDVAPDEKWIAVNLSEQTLAAYEGDQMVFATLVSTGLPWWRTPEGLFRVWVKLIYWPDERRECGDRRLLLSARRAVDHVLLSRIWPARRLLARRIWLSPQPWMHQPEPA